ncbi:hypothetical protein [Acetivibrio mesophilus]|uniref:CBM-cenC domain-containing protein n=1 Tax=Acetivibrio mesophilus TaxID=2487273 RepID=A0A4Q0I0E0_9FIRM|nr:hypothetical protein [Acetivibrio mesophilus]ODM27891.1 hypothetical protein A7W90_17690 [Clostridium sp. Bc-iso-3]RXE57666.1 hypothetical protein EFD62_16370 [Acetivibrio mesophilus]HHV28749.1 hypothetical protein [Clostridium sp.]
MFKKAVAILITAVVLITMTVIPHAETVNRLFNGSFEFLVNGSPANWVMEWFDRSDGATVFAVETADPQLGEKYATITNNVPNDSRYVQTVNVEENKKYKLSCYIKTENVSEEGKGANLSITSQLVTSERIKGTTDGWKYVEMYAVIEEGVSTINVSVGVGGFSGLSTGKASFDNVMVEEVETIPEGAPCAIIKPENNESKNNNSNNNNKGNNSSPKNNESKNDLAKVVWIILIITIIAMGIAIYNANKSGKNLPVKNNNSDENVDENVDIDESSDNEESNDN